VRHVVGVIPGKLEGGFHATVRNGHAVLSREKVYILRCENKVRNVFCQNRPDQLRGSADRMTLVQQTMETPLAIPGGIWLPAKEASNR
jgi:hypothetical protein